MDSTLVINNTHTYCKNLLVMEAKYYAHAPTSSHNDSPYVHATGITNFNTSISQIHNYSTSMTLISPSPYLKTIIKYQTFLSIQSSYMKVFIMPKSKLPCCSKGLSE